MTNEEHYNRSSNVALTSHDRCTIASVLANTCSYQALNLQVSLDNLFYMPSLFHREQVERWIGALADTLATADKIAVGDWPEVFKAYRAKLVEARKAIS